MHLAGKNIALKSAAETNINGSQALFFQPKLSINEPNDPDSYRDEREADEMAAKVMRMADKGSFAENSFFRPALNIQRMCTHCEEEEKLQLKQAPALIQKQDARGQQQQAPNQSWAPSLLSIVVYDDSYNGNCFGIASPGDVSRISTCMKWPSCRTFRIPFRIEFFVDRANTPHPQPVQPGPVSVDIEFIPNGGTANVLYSSTDARPVYKGPNITLQPKFGKMFPVDIDTDGQLSMNISLHDSNSAQDVIFNDKMQFVVLCS